METRLLYTGSRGCQSKCRLNVFSSLISQASITLSIPVESSGKSLKLKIKKQVLPVMIKILALLIKSSVRFRDSPLFTQKLLCVLDFFFLLICYWTSLKQDIYMTPFMSLCHSLIIYLVINWNSIECAVMSFCTDCQCVTGFWCCWVLNRQVCVLCMLYERALQQLGEPQFAPSGSQRGRSIS